MAKEKLFQVGVKALITDDNGKFLVLDSGDWHLKSQKRHWDIPGGRIQVGHGIIETLRREVEEETAIKQLSDIKIFATVISNFPDANIGGQQVGLMLLIYEAKIPAGSEIKLSEEHSGYEWVDRSEAAKRLAYKYPPDFTDLLSG